MRRLAIVLMLAGAVHAAPVVAQPVVAHFGVAAETVKAPRSAFETCLIRPQPCRTPSAAPPAIADNVAQSLALVVAGNAPLTAAPAAPLDALAGLANIWHAPPAPALAQRSRASEPAFAPA